MTTTLPKLAPFTRLSDRVWRVMGLNPGKFTLQGTNTYLVGTGARKLLLDCGEGLPDYVPLLQQSLESISPDAYISDIIITHGHLDHFGGLESVLSAPFFKQRNIRVHKFPPHQTTTTTVDDTEDISHLEHFPCDIPVLPLQDQQVFQTDGATLKVIHTPGHTPDHCTFWLEEEQSIFTADCILGHGTAVFQDLSTYLSGLHALLALNPIRLYPGHGEWIEPGVDKIKEYIDHRQQRERQIIHFMDQHSGASFTPMEIVKVLYKDYPTSLHLPASHSVLLHLLKLEKDGLATWERSLDTTTRWKRADLLEKKWHRL